LARITIRVDDALFRRLDARARDAGTPTATYCRDILGRFEGTDPSGYHARFDELHATGIQTPCDPRRLSRQTHAGNPRTGACRCPAPPPGKGGCSIPSRTRREHLSHDTLGSWTRGGQAIVHNVRMTTQVFNQTLVAGW
jgi:hypothetical protein